MRAADTRTGRCALNLAFRLLKQPLIRRSEIRRWKSGIEAGKDTARVYYGFENVPSAGEHASGGIVKCQDLQRMFPNDPVAPNMLYLVSSALPPHAPLLARLCRRRGGKVVLNQNGVAYPGWYGSGWETVNRPMKDIHSLADHVFYQSGFCQRSAYKFLGRRAGPSEILYNPVDTSLFDPRRTPYCSSALVLLLAGSHEFRYRVTTAVDVLAAIHEKLDGARLLIAGRYGWLPDERASLEDLRDYAHSRGVLDSVDIAGAYTQKEAPDLYRRADLLLHTKYNDPCPRVVVEAMASGLPVVYSASGGVPEQVGSDGGIGLEATQSWYHDCPPNSDQLCRAVLRVLENYERFSAAARKRAVERFALEPWLERHAEVFETLVRTP